MLGISVGISSILGIKYLDKDKYPLLHLKRPINEIMLLFMGWVYLFYYLPKKIKNI
jgi:hypothetical protein